MKSHAFGFTSIWSLSFPSGSPWSIVSLGLALIALSLLVAALAPSPLILLDDEKLLSETIRESLDSVNIQKRLPNKFENYLEPIRQFIAKRRWSDCNREGLESTGAVATDAVDRGKWRSLVCIDDPAPAGSSKPVEEEEKGSS